MLLDNYAQSLKLVLDPWASAALDRCTLQGVIARGSRYPSPDWSPQQRVKRVLPTPNGMVWFVGLCTLPAIIPGRVGGPTTITLPWVLVLPGGTYAAPIWKDFMQQALANVPVQGFRRPSDFPQP